MTDEALLKEAMGALLLAQKIVRKGSERPTVFDGLLAKLDARLPEVQEATRVNPSLDSAQDGSECRPALTVCQRCENDASKCDGFNVAKSPAPATTPERCPHDRIESIMAVEADGLCPLCLRAEVRRLRSELDNPDYKYAGARISCKAITARNREISGLLDELAARSAQPVQAGWQPIETAPFDEEVLVRGWGEGKKHYVFGFARRRKNRSGGELLEDASVSGLGDELWFAPHEFMPLPAAPDTTTERKP